MLRSVAVLKAGSDRSLRRGGGGGQLSNIQGLHAHVHCILSFAGTSTVRVIPVER